MTPYVPFRRLAARAVLSIAAALLATARVHAQQTPPAPAGKAALVGTWRLDLRPTPDSPPAEQDFIIRSVDGDSIVGTFYYSPVRNANFNGAWGPLRFAFTTSDQATPYYHQAVLVAPGRLEGTTHAPGRNALWVWRAVQTSTDPPAARTEGSR